MSLVIISPITAFAQDISAPKVPESTAAVWDLTNLSKSTLSDDTITALTQYIRVKVFNFMPDYRWLDRGRMKEVLEEQKFQASGCTDQSCAVEMGQLLGARKMVTGSVSKTGGTYNLTLSVIDIQTGLVDKSASEICPDCTEGQLYQLAEKTVLNLSGPAAQNSPDTMFAPKHDGQRVHQERLNLDINYPGAGLRYFFTDKMAFEVRGQFADQTSKDTGPGANTITSASVFGARLYRYTSSPSRHLRPYLCLEGDYIAFKGAYSNGNGAAAGAFAGVELFLTNLLSIQTDIGATYITIKDKDTALTDSGLDYVMNFGINIYFNN